MNEGKWEQVKEIFHQAQALPVEDRVEFLDKACAGDTVVREKVDDLLGSYESGFLADSILHEVVEIVGGENNFQEGQVIGRYRLKELIGIGGMGEVYRADDTELNRPVAFKVLHEEVADDKERVRRFIQEARAASALNHPNILTIHEIGSFEGARFIVSEYVDGETLRERMRGGLTSAESLEIMCQIAAALQAAHAAGIVHRDIKPENIMLRQDGLVKVLDFGLAKLTQADDHLQEVRNADRGLRIEGTDSPAWHLSNNPQSEIRNPHLTAPGLIMGTVAYMSPEQARGQAVDSRTDLWSLGVVFHEMLTGESPFKGDSVTDLVTSILKHDPTSLDLKSISQELKPICTKALAKDKKARYQTAQDLLQDLQGEKKRMEYATQSTPFITVSSTDELKTQLIRRRPTLSAEYIVTSVKRHKYATLFAVAFIAASGIGLSVYKYNGATPPSSQQDLSAITFSTTERDLKFSKLPISVEAKGSVISPDGKYVAYNTGDRGLRLLNLETNADAVVMAENNFWGPTFSPDSQFIYLTYGAYDSTDGFKRVSIQGGTPTKVVDHPGDGGPSFSPDGTTMVFTRDLPGFNGQTIQIANLDGSNERTIAKIDRDKIGRDNWIYNPIFSPDAKTLAAAMSFKEGGGTFWKLMRFTIADGKQQVLSDKKWAGVSGAVWLPNGNLVIAASENNSDPSQLWSIPPGGEPKAITSGLVSYRWLSATRAGDTLLATQGSGGVDLWMLPENDTANAKRVTSSGELQGRFTWTPDGRVVIGSNVSGSPDIWIMNPDGTGRKQLTQDPARDAQPTVSSDGKYIAFTSDRVNGVKHIFRMDLDGNDLKQLTSGPHERLPSFSADGKWVYYIDADDDPPATYPTIIRKVSINGGEPTLVATAPEGWGINGMDVNRADGRLVYGLERFSNTLQYKLGILPAQGGQPRLIDVPTNLVSWRPFWTPDKHAIALRMGSRIDIWSVPVDGTGKPRQLTDFKTPGTGDFSWTFDGKQLLVSRGTSMSTPVLIRNVGN